jgi:hypothetical protein
MDRRASTRDDGGKSGRATGGKKKAATLTSTEKAKGRAAGKKANAREPEKKKVLSQEFIEDSDSDAASAKDIAPNVPPSSHSEDDADGEDDDAYLAATNTSAETASGGGGLEIILGEDDIPAPQRKRARTLPHSNPGLPMSLRSAANSPSSQIATPPRQPVSLRGVQEEREDEDDANYVGRWGEGSARDEDVVSIDLNATGRSAGGMDDEDVDDFEAQLSKAFEVGDLEEVESEESEAE